MESENNYTETDLGNVSPNPRGEYNSETAYEYLDLVNYQGGSYICTPELGKTITGIGPVSGKDTENWQLLTLPGDLTPDYVAMHDNVVQKAKQVESSRAAIELSQQEVEAAQADVKQMRQDTQSAAQDAQESKESASGYAQSADSSRLAAEQAEQNATAQVQGFDMHVAAKVEEADQAITEARSTAINVVNAQGDKTAKTLKQIEEEVNSAVSTAQGYATNASNSAASATSAASGATSAANAASAAKDEAVAAKTAAETAKSSAESILKSVKETATTATTDINDAKTKAITDINDAGTAQKNAVDQAGTDQKAAVKEEGTKQIDAMNEIKKTIDTTASNVQKNKDSVDTTKTEIEKLKEDVNANAKKALTDISTAKTNAIAEVNEDSNVQQIAKNKTAIEELKTTNQETDKRMTVVEKQLANNNLNDANIDNIILDVEAGLASTKYPVGTKLITNWDRLDQNSTKTSYKPELNIVHYANTAVKDTEDDEERNANVMYLEWDKTIPDGIAFCITQSLQVFDGTEGAPDGLPAGDYSVKMKAKNGGTTYRNKWDGKYANFTISKAIPSGGIMRLTVQDWNGTSDTATAIHVITTQGINESDAKIEEVLVTQSANAIAEGYTFMGEVWGEDVGFGKLNHCECCYYGDNNWATSDLRQWLNSEGLNWWKQQTRYHRKPNIATKIQGYLTGLDEDIKKNIVLTKNQTIGNNQKYPNQKFVTYDKIFLHSFNQNNITTDFSSQYDNEGERWEYYKKLAEGISNLNGSGMFKIWNTYTVLIRYAINAPTTAQYVFSRSANLDTAYIVHSVTSSGNCNGTARAHTGSRCLPACCIANRNHAV